MILEEFSEDKFQKALQLMIRALTLEKTISEQPQAILLSGQSRAGKTTIHRIKQKEFHGNIIILDGDSYRSQHLNYLALQEKYVKDSMDYTKGFAGKIVEHLVNELSTQGYHLLVEETLRITQVPRQVAQLLSSKEPQASLAVIGAKLELCYLSTLIRYEKLYIIDPNQTRITPKERYDGIVENLVYNLRELESYKLFDRIQIYQRDKRCVYDSETDEGLAANVLQECLFGKWSKVYAWMLKVGQGRFRELREN